MDNIFKAFREMQMIKELKSLREAFERDARGETPKCPNCGCPCHDKEKED